MERRKEVKRGGNNKEERGKMKRGRIKGSKGGIQARMVREGGRKNEGIMRERERAKGKELKGNKERRVEDRKGDRQWKKARVKGRKGERSRKKDKKGRVEDIRGGDKKEGGKKEEERNGKDRSKRGKGGEKGGGKKEKSGKRRKGEIRREEK